MIEGRWMRVLGYAGAIGIAALAMCLTQCTNTTSGRTATVLPPAADKDTLRPVADFAGIEDPRERSVALFREVSKVIDSPRCLNCHPSGDRPSQGDAMKPHQPLVLRGADGFGMTGMRCASCHQADNAHAAGVPGNLSWHLAPHTMAWQGKTVGQICAQLKDKKLNGDRDLEALIEHMGTDPLVGWAWVPDKGRKPAPGTQKQFGALFKAWTESGAQCPS